MTGTVLDPAGVDEHGHLHLFHSPGEVESAVLDVAGHLNAITEHLGLQLQRLQSARADADYAALSMAAAATLRESLEAVRAPVEALARAEVFASLSRDMQGWVQIQPAERHDLLATASPPVLTPGLWVNSRQTPTPLAQVYSSFAVGGREVRDVYWPTGVNSMSSWIRRQPFVARRWRKPPAP
ncbi:MULTISPECIES: hypothetical protein [unclassified Pseudoclavibacter]|uniref:hypothetical protein n=1 Tax=unclassified Pseudoclavibacter TaxID=2615177 RepID=UPI001BABA74A|nr:hypothetical protein [Pseudoclavibacter sp. Marseille-Q4354]MBS3177256.1 hypothetical protein [Pseudoclavibacter sp. Marseille-Q4354]